ncbi:hypothetical protein HDV03_004835 [Kappamyces sp. JEL0829]|nr:hypothetical protein HDV03_004835 [Kappamyces sp. JEL0829]
MNFVFPAILYSIFSQKTSTLNAIVISGIPPFVDACVYVATERKMDAINALAIFGTIFGAIFAYCTNDPKLLLLKDSIVTSFFGFGFLLSLFFKENLVWWYNRTFSPPEKKEILDAEWENPTIRRATVVLCYVWGSGYLLEAVLRVILLYLINIDLMVYISIMAPFVFSIIMGLWSWGYTKRVRARYQAETEHEISLQKVKTSA